MLSERVSWVPGPINFGVFDRSCFDMCLKPELFQFKMLDPACSLPVKGTMARCTITKYFQLCLHTQFMQQGSSTNKFCAPFECCIKLCLTT